MRKQCILFTFFCTCQVAPLLAETPLDCPNLSVLQAIQYTLQNENRVKVQQAEMVRSFGVARQARSPFDYQARGEVQKSFSPLWRKDNLPDYRGYDYDFSAGVNKKLRTGTQINTLLDYTQKPNSLFGTSPLGLIDALRFNVDIVQPLLKGLFYGSQRMRELAAFAEYEATLFSSMHEIARRVSTTVDFYWQAVSQREALRVQNASVARFRKLLKATKRFVEEKRVAKSELFQPIAELARQKRERDATRQRYFTAVQQLNLAMGFVDNHFIIPAKSLSLEAIPSVEELSVYRNPQDLVQLGCHNRLDLQAGYKRVDRFDYLLQGSQNDRLAQIDVIGSYKQPIAAGLETDRSMNEWLIGAQISFPLYNDDAIGQVIQDQANVSRAKFEVNQTSLEIKANVLESWHHHLSLLDQVRDADSAVENFQSSLDAEVERLRQGYSSIFRVVEYENRLTNAELRLVETKLQMAQNLLNLRFQTGCLLKFHPDSKSMTIEDVKRVP